jgi:hypothetical protein
VEVVAQVLLGRLEAHLLPVTVALEPHQALQVHLLPEPEVVVVGVI